MVSNKRVRACRKPLQRHLDGTAVETWTGNRSIIKMSIKTIHRQFITVQTVFVIPADFPFCVRRQVNQTQRNCNLAEGFNRTIPRQPGQKAGCGSIISNIQINLDMLRQAACFQTAEQK